MLYLETLTREFIAYPCQQRTCKVDDYHKLLAYLASVCHKILLPLCKLYSHEKTAYKICFDLHYNESSYQNPNSVKFIESLVIADENENFNPLQAGHSAGCPMLPQLFAHFDLFDKQKVKYFCPSCHNINIGSIDSHGLFTCGRTRNAIINTLVYMSAFIWTCEHTS